MDYKNLLLFLTVFLLLAGTVSAGEISINIMDSVENYTQNQGIAGSAEIVYSRYIPQDSLLNSYIDGKYVSSVSLSSYLHDPSYYYFRDQQFQYNITAYGINNWVAYSNQDFNYMIRVSGTCGGGYCGSGCICPCSSPYPCDWSADTGYLTDSVNANEGLKYIYNASITLPEDSNDDTEWSVTYNSNQNVETTMRQACGGQYYKTETMEEGYWVDSGGWVTHMITGLTGIQGTFDREGYIEPFDHHSLDSYRDKYNPPEPGGGIYKCRDSVCNYLSYGQAEWDGETGYIRINNYDSLAQYYITYLPPSGPMLCAYTEISEPGSENWARSATVSGTVSYGSNYTKQYTSNELETMLQYPDCPPETIDCIKMVNSYEVKETYDPADSVTVEFQESSKTVRAFTEYPELSMNYSADVNLGSFANLKAPNPGYHNLTLSIFHGGDLLQSGEAGFYVCLDNDMDGFCSNQDCDDFDPLVNPDGTEACNGVDDDCDGEIDEDFWAPGSKLGNPCGIGACAGIWVCTGDGNGTACSGNYNPGELKEVCYNSIDDDCDGATDELFEDVAGRPVEACVCKIGGNIVECGNFCDVNDEMRPCGNDTGYCRKGYQRCLNHVWSECMDEVGPRTETCNSVDDDCDGVVDDVRGGSSRESTRCGCYGGAQASKEVCNDIDDDCDGEVDEGVQCCRVGERRSCGTDVGACTTGTQTCSVDGSWGECVGSVEPAKEICFNKLDDNCNGAVDENCGNLTRVCSNRVRDNGEEGIDCGGFCQTPCEPDHMPLQWYMVAAAGIVIVVVIGILGVMGKF